MAVANISAPKPFVTYSGFIDLTQDDDNLIPAVPEDDSIICLTPRILSICPQSSGNSSLSNNSVPQNNVNSSVLNNSVQEICNESNERLITLVNESTPYAPIVTGNGTFHSILVNSSNTTRRKRRRTVDESDRLTNLQHENLRKIECGVCYDGVDQITSSGRELVSSICGHVFCNECLVTSIRGTRKCPNCRKKLTLKQYHPLFL
ncbi:E3 ubiquitin-protein ligase complex slx8-rfp subunit rfp2-like [Stegodyphus dumicola]|uniref:E3 ubiquitin-protein ligase complex slx8-rfp subunit rfp2-like n=1 Tax=Stegodyphus dumicola TaxID=202533 RepID=UPI0015AFA61C|nr:E3 ubiquitin-protein ligase complex slx8-rfp subunit rfp2-like [Stegodyphus dumicola]